jgi:hypothetical protein
MDLTYDIHEIGRVYSAEPTQAPSILSFLILPLSLESKNKGRTRERK